MKIRTLVKAVGGVLNPVLLAVTASAAMNEDPLTAKVTLEKMEMDLAASGAGAWSVNAWSGYALSRLVLKTQGSLDAGQLAQADVQALYSQAIAPFQAIQWGIRATVESDESSYWGVIAWQGLLPFHLDMTAAVFLSEQGQVGLQVEWDYDLQLSRKFLLTTALEANLYDRNDTVHKRGAGLAETEWAISLGYEVTRAFMPYTGFRWQQQYGKTAEWLDASASETTLSWVVGFSAWF